MKVKYKYRECPVCDGSPRIEEINDIYFIECECGLTLVLDHDGNELL